MLSCELHTFIIIIIYLLKSTEQEDAHMINTRTRAGQESHRKLALTFCPLKNKKTNTLDIKTTTTTHTVKRREIYTFKFRQ